MSKLLNAVNTLLASIGEEPVENLTEPSALMAKTTLDFVLTELPYTTEDFPITYDSLPQAVYNYVVVKASRKFQNNAISSEILHQFTQEDENEAKRLLIRKKLIPKDILVEVDEELAGMLSYATKVPKALKDNIAILKFQALLFDNPETYVVSKESVEAELLEFKKNLILTRNVPIEIVQKVRDHYYARYGFTGIIPVEITEESQITETLKLMASYEFQKAILPSDNYVILTEERNQDELDFRLALIANRMLPSDLHKRVMDEFLATYGKTPSQLTPPMREYILSKAMYRLQSILIPNKEQHPITDEDIDNAEATLISLLITPKLLFERVLKEVKVELSIHEDVPEENLPQAVINYAKYRSAFIHQPTCIKRASKYVISEVDVVRAKALAGQSLPAVSLMASDSVARIMDRSSTPNVTAGNPRAKYRLKV